MDVVSNSASRERTERQWRITAALFESAIGTAASLEALIGRLYRRDPASLAHLYRVASLAVRIGEELRLPDKALDELEMAALVHDIGRLIVPDVEKMSFGPLDSMALQRRAMQVRVAHDVMKDHPFLRPVAAVVGSSLECFDGSGAPEGLCGQHIPVGARVLHVADMLDGLQSICATLDCSTDLANAELVRLAGGRFDPDVVAAWLRCSEEIPASLLPWWSAVDRMN